MVGVESICCWDWDACGIWAALGARLVPEFEFFIFSVLC